jgi:AraC-like DNA-binding protein
MYKRVEELRRSVIKDDTKEPFRFKWAQCSLGSSLVGVLEHTAYAVEVVDQDFVACGFSLGAPLAIRGGAEAVRCAPGEGAVALPGRRFIDKQAGRHAYIRIPKSLVLTEGDANWDSKWSRVIAGDECRALRTLIDAVVEELGSDQPMQDRRKRLWEALIADAASAIWAANDEETGAAAASLKQVRRGEAFIQDCKGDSLSVTAVANHVGVSVRALQLAFRKHRGKTPHKFISYTRLKEARLRLLAAKDGETVTKIALDCGLVNLGRFAGEYRKKFGEPPSRTLMTALRRVTPETASPA